MTALHLSTATLPVILAATAIIAPGTSNARPAPSMHDHARPLGASATVTDRGTGSDRISSRADARRGEVTTIRDAGGVVATQLAPGHLLGGAALPQQIPADRRTVAPVVGRAAYLPHADTIASDAENTLAQQNFTSQLGMGTTIGSLVGTALGAVVGAGLGFALAGAACSTPPFVQCVVIALPTIAAAAGVGGIVGTVVAGGGTLVYAGYDYVKTLTSAPFTTHWQVQIDQQNSAPPGRGLARSTVPGT